MMIIPNRSECFPAATNLNADLAALCEYGRPWNIQFAPQKTSLLLIPLKSEISSHPPLFLNHTWIPEVSSIKVLEFLFDSALTWQKHIDSVLCLGKQRLGQLYRY